MIDSTKPIDDATPLDDTSGLKLPKNKSYTLRAACKFHHHKLVNL